MRLNPSRKSSWKFYVCISKIMWIQCRKKKYENKNKIENNSEHLVVSYLWCKLSLYMDVCSYEVCAGIIPVQKKKHNF